MKEHLGADEFKSLDEIQEYIDNAIKYTRTLTCELSPPVLYQFGLEAAIEWLCERMQNSHGINCKLKNDNYQKPLGDDIKVLVFQIVRELMFNIVKHAKASSAVVELKRDGGDLQVSVRDDGVGFDVHLAHAHSSGFGLFSIRERLNHMKGNIKINSCPGQGTDVILTAPLLCNNANG